SDKTSQLSSGSAWACSCTAFKNASGVQIPPARASSHTRAAPSVPERGCIKLADSDRAVILVSSCHLYVGLTDLRRYRRFRRLGKLLFLQCFFAATRDREPRNRE